MLKLLKNLSERRGVAKERAPFEPAVFNDVVAVQTGWHPLERGGASFRTRRFVRVDADRVELKPTLGALLFGAVFGGFGVMGMGMAGLLLFSPTSEAPRWWALFPLCVGSVFVAVAVWLTRKYSAPVVFDTRHGWYWAGREDPAAAVNRNALKRFAELEDVHALQLISEFCRGDDHSYHSYELNLILKDAKRVNVFDHGSLEHARGDAKKIADFLDIPLWDAIHR